MSHVSLKFLCSSCIVIILKYLQKKLQVPLVTTGHLLCHFNYLSSNVCHFIIKHTVECGCLGPVLTLPLSFNVPAALM